MLRRTFLSLSALLVITGLVLLMLLVLREPEVVAEAFAPRESHAAYAEGLTQLELDETYMGNAWLQSGRRALGAATAIALPYAETLILDPNDPGAVSFWFPVTRGRQVVVAIEAEHEFYFADMYRLQRSRDAAQEQMPEVDELIASRNGNRIEFEARRNGFYLLRLQPELLRGGQFSLTLSESAPLAFPVQGTDQRDIWSFYGDPRDGGRREHHGIDVFAPRGTPVLAASRSEVVRVGERDRGGLVVVLFDRERELMLYYAHLDQQWVREGEVVEAGEPIGTVGNTGNAITTPPHLHLGLYQGGWRQPVDPWPFFVGPDGRPRTAAELRSAAAEPSITGPASAVPEPPVPLGSRAALARPAELSNSGTVDSPLPPVSSIANRNQHFRDDPTPAVFEGGESPPDASWIPPRPVRIPLSPAEPLRVVGVSDAGLRVQTPEGSYVKLAIPGMLSGVSDAPAAFTVQQRSVARDPRTGDTVAGVEPGTRVTVLAVLDRARGLRLVRLDGRELLLVPVNVAAAG